MLTQASGTPRGRLMSTFIRWEPAKVVLGPAIETLPVFLTIPIILFIVGLLDNLFSRALQISHFSNAIRAAAWVSTGAVFVVGALLLYALTHACLYPKTSPFRSTISDAIRFGLRRSGIPRIRPYLEHVLRSPDWTTEFDDEETKYSGCDELRGLPSGVQSSRRTSSRLLGVSIRPILGRVKRGLRNVNRRITRIFPRDDLMPEEHVYHKVLQITHDDDSLNKASGALHSMLRTRILRSWKPGRGLVERSKHETLLSSLEVDTLIHLLSPEGSYRSSLGAAQSILKLNSLLVPLPSSCELIISSIRS